MVHKTKIDKTWTIKNFLVIPGFILTISLSVAIIAAISTYSYQNLRQVFRAQLEGNTRLFVETITNPILMGQDQVVYQACLLFKEQGGVKWIRVLRSHSIQPVCEIGTITSTGLWELALEREILFSSAGGDQAASVNVIYDLGALRSNILSWITLGLVLAIGMMISNWFLYRILDRKVAEPISRISRIISKGDPRQIVSAVEGSSSPVFEVNLLEEKAVEMAKRIMEYQADLKRRERDKATGELARQIAHDIRSPLGALKILNSQLSTNAAQAELMKDVISRVEGMAENLLDKSRKLPEPISATSICESLDRLSKTFEIKCLERSVQLQTNFTMINMISQVYANMGQFERIVNNLLENALDASFSNSMISVSALLEGQFFIVNVEEQGKGLPAEIEEALGAGTARSTKPGGNGLGLLSVYQTVKDWSGEVTYAKLNPGSRFSIKLPLF